MLIGDSAVGKTSIVNVRVGRGFKDVEMASLGLDFVSQNVRPKSNPNFEYSLKVWDTAGQERFHSMTTAFYKQSHGMIICFDVTREKTFESVQRWVSACQEKCEDGIPMLLAGNKADLEDDREIPTEEGEAIARRLGIKYIEVSAKTNLNIDSVFDEMIQMVYQKKFAAEHDVPLAGAGGAAKPDEPQARVTITRKSESAAKKK